MTSATRDDLLKALSAVRDPKSGKSVVEAGLIQGLVVKDGHAGFMIEVAPDVASLYERTRAACEAAAKAVPGVTAVTAVLTAHSAEPAAKPAAAAPRAPTPQALPGVRHIVAVASGKGGVGKSTVAVNLAFALAAQGRRVGLMDADIYGPSVPHLLKLTGKPVMRADKTIAPMERDGVKAMSIGLLIDPDTPAIWRGPVATGALTQLLTQVAWGDTDILIVDMPPGTGDIHLSLTQRVALSGAVIVSTPQDIALLDARKGIAMFRKVEVPILGIVENMSHYVCPNCGHEEHLFGAHGARRTAEELGAPFIGEVPLHLSIREGSDAGAPVVLAHPQSAEARAFFAIAGAVAAALESGRSAKPAPVIEFV